MFNLLVWSKILFLTAHLLRNIEVRSTSGMKIESEKALY
jgi:hypothetical protein